MRSVRSSLCGLLRQLTLTLFFSPFPPQLIDFQEQIKRVMRPTDVPDTGLLCDLLWSDPDKDIVGWGENDR